MTIVEFLEARLSEDEAEIARRVASGWNTRRRLREVAAKRAIIEAAWGDQEQIENEWGHCLSREQMTAKDDVPDAVRIYAALYADHPDYNPAWAAEATV